MARSSTDRIIDDLEDQYPGWEVWTSRRFLGGERWLARRDDDGLELDEASSGALAQAIKAEEAGEEEQGSWWSR